MNPAGSNPTAHGPSCFSPQAAQSSLVGTNKELTQGQLFAQPAALMAERG